MCRCCCLRHPTAMIADSRLIRQASPRSSTSTPTITSSAWMNTSAISMLTSKPRPKVAQRVKLLVNYDPHYCRALIAKGSTWDLHLSDWLRAKLNSRAIIVDGKKTGVVKQELTPISFVAGPQAHNLEIR